jgi:hypothetical protein
LVCVLFFFVAFGGVVWHCIAVHTIHTALTVAASSCSALSTLKTQETTDLLLYTHTALSLTLLDRLVPQEHEVLD